MWYTRDVKAYLDTCSLQRPLDSKTQVRIAVEAEAILGVIALCEAGELELVSSQALVYEVSRTSQMERQEFARAVLSRADTFIAMDEDIEARAREFNQLGIQPLDALHLASAEEAGADYFCTCDDRFLKKAKAVDNLKTIAVSPLELIEDIER